MEDNTKNAIITIENFKRAKLHPVDLAISLKHLQKKYNLTQADLANMVDRKQNTISEILNINKLSKKFLDKCKKENKISMRFMIELSKFKDEEEMEIQLKRFQKYKISSNILREERKKCLK